MPQETEWIEVTGKVVGFIGDDAAVVNVQEWRIAPKEGQPDIPWTPSKNAMLPFFMIRWTGHDYHIIGDYNEDQLEAGNMISFVTCRGEVEAAAKDLVDNARS